jgi:antitoxin ParD1/3/4
MVQVKSREKLSISLPESSVLFVEQYRARYSIPSRSEVIEIALRSLRERELERNYAEAAADEAEFEDIECATADGLDDDLTW